MQKKWMEYFPSRELFLAWVAGFFDGEGSVVVATQKHSGTARGLHLYLYISIVQINRLPLDLIWDEWGGHISEDKKACQSDWRIKKRFVWRWKCSNAVGKKFLSDIAPFCVQKKDEVNLARKWPSGLSKNGKGLRRVSDEEFLCRVIIRDELKRLRFVKKSESEHAPISG